MKRLFILAGANGSGKSTVGSEILPQENSPLVNPDDIARAMSLGDVSAAKVPAGREALRRIGEFLAAGASFAVESTLSGQTLLSLIEKAKQLGYSVEIIYVFLDSPEMCIARIAVRVAKGGHDIPDDDVRRRYFRSKRNFLNQYALLADAWTLVYNGGELPVMVAECKNGQITVFDKKLFDNFEEGI